jgi:hypothetical protein
MLLGCQCALETHLRCPKECASTTHTRKREVAVFCLSTHPRFGGCIGSPAGPSDKLTAQAASMAVASQMLPSPPTPFRKALLSPAIVLAGRAKTGPENAKEAEGEDGLPWGAHRFRYGLLAFTSQTWVQC